MANPQVEDGYIRIANELWNEVLRRAFSKRQTNLILFIWRLSYGTGQKDCMIPSFMNFELAGMYKQDVKKELTFLRDCAVLDWDPQTMVFCINKNYHLWQITPNKKWDNERFNQLLKKNVHRKKANTSDAQPVTAESKQVSHSLTKPNKQVSKSLTTKLVKYLPENGDKPMVVKDPASRKTEERKDRKECNSYRDPHFCELLQFYRENLQIGITDSPYNYELLTQWYEEYGYELVMEAMRIATKAEAKGVKYLESVLLNWAQMGVKTAADVKVMVKQRKTNHMKPAYQKNRADVKRDIIPDWYVRQREQPAKQNTETEAEKERKAAEVDRMLEAYLMGEV
ncbi:replication protein [Gracilibacillus caseinilyticus]|uniref:Replication protein n=1 Tax=Gracilibacillus caseinilyticus TaxID=2932256 RepID=A0ABY4F7C7_9BACI|nr:replication protein [Gracilibacillus caseinilyticus]UOQ50351.1 replication protein [Gracilibacillus caseinilyticus]